MVIDPCGWNVAKNPEHKDCGEPGYPVERASQVNLGLPEFICPACAEKFNRMVKLAVKQGMGHTRGRLVAPISKPVYRFQRR